MVAVEFRFLAGRYHATPWDRHVNEGAVAWPPEPWRILRALISTWHHKVKWSEKHSKATMQGLTESLAQELPEYRLPPASHSHARHYMPPASPKESKPLVLDAFAAVDCREPLVVVWPTVELSAQQRTLLGDLLQVMGYLGRAESWIDARPLDHAPETNCRPMDFEGRGKRSALGGEPVTLLAALPPEEYARRRSQFLQDKGSAKRLAPTLPEDFLDALCVDTGTLRQLGWSQPPAARKVQYLRPVDALTPRRHVKRHPVRRNTTAVFVLTGKPLPRVEETVRIGELLRIAVLSRAKHRYGEHNIPAVFSGHGLVQNRPHRHAFYVPWDSNGDGYIDRLLVHVPDGMDAEQQRVLEALNRLWSRDGYEWRVLLEGISDSELAPELTGPSAVWVSCTPYLHPWHVKKRFTVQDQIRRECRARGLPEPSALESLAEVNVGKGRMRRPIHFRRFRSRRGLNQPDRLGSFWRLRFPEPIRGPLALGFSCHFGLGLFKPL
ncbi:type I-G CRISPR-associated protein Csb2 [Desulfosoma caldarium]|uniref:CRISPR-associated protein Csb2 n=1 Tax=Desulfosoma caldarium TaxID=610254 RepID=A0A3N1UF71_9BACT|nr:type I-U CRISPR-associated protein Csb2 [Desulfosoma caldarium]ROQ89904.1 CRISPR-associated protein Csb2 [Desulfosoma caldarium]